MKNLVISLVQLFLVINLAQADTPPGASVKSWIYDSGGNTLSSTSGALDVNCTNCSGGGGGTVNQGTGGISPWAVQFLTPQAVTGIFFQSVQPVSQSGSWSVLQSGTWNVGRTWNLLNSTDSVSSFQGGSWSVTSNIGTTGGLALDATLSALSAKFNSLGQKTSTNSVPVVIASDQSSLAVTGTFFQSIQPVSQSGSWSVLASQSGTWTTGRTWNLSSGSDSVNVGNFPSTYTVVQPSGTNLHVDVDSVPTTTVTGTVTVNQGTAGGSPWPVSGTFTSAATPDFSGSGSLTAACSTPSSCGAGSTVDLSQNTSSLGNMELEVQGTWVGTILMEGSNDSGANWKSFSVVLPSPAAFSSAGVTSNGYYRTLGVGSFKWIRARMNPYTSGTAVVTLRASVGPDVVGVVQSNPANLATGSWYNNSGTQVEGTADSSGNQIVNAQGKANSAVQAFSVGTSNPLQTDLRGAQLTVPLDGMRATYSASFGISPATTATDIFTIGGSGSKTIRILQVEMWPSETTAALKQIFLVVRSSANSGGTSSAGVAVPFDSNSPAATAPITIYSANPTSLGALVGSIRSANMNIGPGTTTDPETLVRWDFGNNSGQAVVLRGTSQFLAMNLNSITFTGGSIYVSVTWTEE
jgi:hypothetical protein